MVWSPPTHLWIFVAVGTGIGVRIHICGRRYAYSPPPPGASPDETTFQAKMRGMRLTLGAKLVQRYGLLRIAHDTNEWSKRQSWESCRPPKKLNTSFLSADPLRMWSDSGAEPLTHWSALTTVVLRWEAQSLTPATHIRNLSMTRVFLP